MEIKKDIKTNNKNRKPSCLTRFLWWCAGVDVEIIKQCPHEWSKYASMGATILFTGILAMLSGGYAMYTVFRDGTLTDLDADALKYACAFGVLWGLVIFNLDRYIITTFKKSNSDIAIVRLGSDLLHALPRIILAVIIAITISKPIELKIFESRLAQQIKENEQDVLERNAHIYTGIYGVEQQKKDTANTKAEKRRLEEERQNKPQSVVRLEKKLEQIKDDISTEERKVKQAKNERKKIWNNRDNFNFQLDTLGNLVWIKEVKYLKSNKRSDYQRYGREKKDAESKIKELKEEKESVGGQIEEEWQKHNNGYDVLIAQNDSTLTNQSEQLSDSQEKARIANEKADSIASIAYRNNFVTQLEALGDLKRAQIKETDDEFIKQEKREEARNFALISWAITLLFLCIELAPMLTKLITSRGSYDDMIDARESEIKYECLRRQKQVEQEFEWSIKSNDAEKETHYQESVVMNQKLMSKIAETQLELLDVAIGEWRKEELEKIKANPSQYVKSNTNN